MGVTLILSTPITDVAVLVNVTRAKASVNFMNWFILLPFPNLDYGFALSL
jgi:Zn-dependent protease